MDHLQSCRPHSAHSGVQTSLRAAYEPLRECDFLGRVLHDLQQHLPYPWIAVRDSKGIHVLLLSRDEEKSVQRRVFFCESGEEKVSVHRRVIPDPILKCILLQELTQKMELTSEQKLGTFVNRIKTVVQRLQTYEVCIGVDDAQYKPLWTTDECGEIDKNPYGELRYKETFRPFSCHIVVSTAKQLKRRCSVCIQTKIRFRVKV